MCCIGSPKEGGISLGDLNRAAYDERHVTRGEIIKVSWKKVTKLLIQQLPKESVNDCIIFTDRLCRSYSMILDDV